MDPSVDTIIDACGGTGAVAKLLSLSDPAVSCWRSRGGIPAEYWASIVRLASDRGRKEITLEMLADLAARSGRREVTA